MLIFNILDLFHNFMVQITTVQNSLEQAKLFLRIWL